MRNQMGRKKKRILLIEAVLVVVLAGIYLLMDHFLAAEEQKKARLLMQEEASKVLLALENSRISGITIRNGEETVRLCQTEGKWMCPEDPVFVMADDRIMKMTKDLNPLMVRRRLEDDPDPEAFGLLDDGKKIIVEETGGKHVTILVGDRNTVSGGLYIQEEGDSAVYLTDVPLDKDFAADLKSLAAYETAPVFDPSRIRMIEVSREQDPYCLDTPGDDTCTVKGEDGKSQGADLSIVGLVQNRLGNLSWLSDLEYHCTDLAGYGLDPPRAVLTVTSEDGETTELQIGDTDENGNYYVRLGSGTQVHSVRREYLKELVEGKAEDFWSLSYSFVSIGDLESLEVTYGDQTVVLRPGSQETDSGWYVDNTDVGKEAFTRFYYSCVSITAQQRIPEVVQPADEAQILGLIYHLTDGSDKVIRYYPQDQDVCLVVYDNGSKAAYVNRMYVKKMTDNLEMLLGS